MAEAALLKDVICPEALPAIVTSSSEILGGFSEFSAISLMLAVVSSEALAALLPVLCVTQAQQTASLSSNDNRYATFSWH